MLGTVIVFLAIMVAVLWYLMDGADEDKDSHEKREPRRGNGRKKSRRKGLRRGETANLTCLLSCNNVHACESSRSSVISL